MGHRALIIHEVHPDRWNCYYSHWGAVNLRLRDDLADEYRNDPAGHEQIDAEPFASVQSVEEALQEQLNTVSHEAVYIVPTTGGEVEALRPLAYHWHGFDSSAPEEDHEGNERPESRTDCALYSPRWYDGEPIEGRTMGKFEGYKLALGDAVYDELRTWPEAIEELDAWVFGHIHRRGSESGLSKHSPRGRFPNDTSQATYRTHPNR